jgi:hypothetical protein
MLLGIDAGESLGESIAVSNPGESREIRLVTAQRAAKMAVFA